MRGSLWPRGAGGSASRACKCAGGSTRLARISTVVRERRQVLLSKAVYSGEQGFEGFAVRLLPANKVKVTQRSSGTDWCIRQHDLIEHYGHEPSAICGPLPKLLDCEHQLFPHV